MFYMWDQNNTGGTFVTDEDVTHRVIIEADNYEQAEQKAFDLGVYYNGSEEGSDCPCCGDRWYEGSEVKIKAGQSIEDFAQYYANNYGWCTPDIYIYKEDGSKTEIFKVRK